MKFHEFKGMAPKVARSQRNPAIAVEAVNTTFGTGALKRSPLDVTPITYSDLKPTQTGAVNPLRGMFYSHQADAWFGFGSRVRRGVDSLISPQDTYKRVYFADDNGIRYLTSDQYTDDAVNLSPTTYKLGIPPPDQAPSVNKVSETIPPEVSTEDVVRQKLFYVFTLVDQYGHEGPPSPASVGVVVPVEYPFRVDVSTSSSGTDLAGRAFGSNAKKRIYRSTSGSSGADFQYVGEVPLATTVLQDTVPYGEEMEVIVSSSWFPPPDGVAEIDAVASNFLAGFHDNILCFSELKLPHAWPLEYRFPLRYKIVAIQSTANGMFIGTTGKPYWAFGGDPQAAVPQELDYEYACIDRDSVADVNGAVLYASHAGVVAVAGDEAQLITRDIFTQQQWKDLSSDGIKAAAYEGKYLFHSVAAEETYIVDVSDPTGMVLFQSSDPAVMESLKSLRSTAYDLRRDRTVLIAESGSARLMEAVGTPPQAPAPVMWESEVVLTPREIFTGLRVRANKYPVVVSVRVSNSAETHIETPYTVSVESEDPVRLPAMRPSSTLRLTVDLSDADPATEVYDVDIVSSMAELRNV